MPQYDPVTGTYIKPNSILEGVFNAYKNNVLSAIGVGMGNDPWKQSAYLAQILDFASIVKDRGLAAALDTYAAGIFNQAAIGSIVNLSGSVRNYFEQKIANHEYTDSTDGEGFITRNYDVEDFGYIETAFDEFGNEYVTKVSIMGNTREGDFGIDAYSRFGLKTGELATRFGDEYLMLQRIENGEQAYAEIRDWDTGEVLLVISPRTGGGYNVYNDRGEYINAMITDYLNNRRYAFDDAKLNYYSELDGTNSVPLVEMDWSDPDTFRLMFGNPSISADDISSINLTEQDKEQIIRYILLNGINNPNANGVSPGYMKGITQQLALADPNAEGSIFIPLYEQGGLVKDAWKWYNDVYLKSDIVTDDILGEYIAKFGATAGSDLVGIAYSGGGDPLIQALNKRSDIDMKSLVFVGAPLKYGRQITNPNVENVISIEGGWDAVVALAGGYFRSFEENPRPLNLYRIALGGVDHFHYTYDPNDTNPDPLKVKSAAFISKVTKYANNTAELNRFLTQTQGITYDDARKIYFVDLDKVRYDQ